MGILPNSLGRQLRYAYQGTIVKVDLVGCLAMLLMEEMGVNKFFLCDIVDMFFVYWYYRLASSVGEQ